MSRPPDTSPIPLLLALAVLGSIWACAGCGAGASATRASATGAASTGQSDPPPTARPAHVAHAPQAMHQPALVHSPQRRPATKPPRVAAPVHAAPSHAAPSPRRATAPPVVKPRTVWDPIPFGAKRKAQMQAYALRHYGLDTYRLVDPHVIVIHYTVTPDFQATYNTFAPDIPDPELHELPGTCAHFVIDKAGVIHQLVALDIMCRHTVGLNWTAIGIEHVGYSDAEVLDNPRQMAASLRLVRWLRCRYGIAIRNVIGHNESLQSPYHHEDVTSLRDQTHEDFVHADMNVYRSRLAAAGRCPAG
jgi:N-acetylmuramoyl-L-alanine amidase